MDTQKAINNISVEVKKNRVFNDPVALIIFLVEGFRL